MVSIWEQVAHDVSYNTAVESATESTTAEKKYRPLQSVKRVAYEEEPSDGWKPLSLSTPILVGVTALTLLLAAAIETLAQRSKAQGGLALSPSLDDMPEYAKLSYLYVPNIIAVLYSIIWSWIDLDAKRMQPWFELSKPEGAKAEDSIFLDYQYDFVASVPFKAAKKKHWPVFFAGTAMVIVFWLLTPLQSALLGTSAVEQTLQATIEARSQLRPLIEQEALLSPQVLNTGYAIGWLDQPYPSFTTSKYALLPFYLENDPAPATVPTNWTAETTKLSTELSCWPAEIVKDGPRSKASFHFLNGQGCNVTISLNTNANFTMLYIGYSNSPYSDYALANPECPKTSNSAHQFLAIWATPIPVSNSMTPDFNLTALYCQPHYYKQKVLVTVDSKSLEPVGDSIQALSRRELLTEGEFNSTAFEFLLGNGKSQNVTTRDWPFNNVVEQQPRINDTGLTKPASNMVGFALAGRNLAITDYSSSKTLENVYYDAHQHLFSVAVDDLLINSTEISNTTASVRFSLQGVVVSRPFATTVECLLGIVAVFTVLVLWFSRTAPSNLPMNPSSLARHIDLFRDSPELLLAFQTVVNVDEQSLIEEFRQDKFRLVFDYSSNCPRVSIDKSQRDDSSESAERRLAPQKGYYEPVRPWVLKRWTGSLFVVVLAAGITGICYLKEQEKKLEGLYRPSENFEVLQLLENYIPTIFATLIEPLWVLLNRMLCVLQPFKNLWEGKAKPSISIDATYTSLPPQLILFRAMKSGHFVLVLVCSMALLANVLAVGLGSLFNERPMIANYQDVSQPVFGPRFDNYSVSNFSSSLMASLTSSPIYQDHMYVALANMSAGTTLPAWVSQEYFFQRYKASGSIQKEIGNTYTMTTRGFGANANCTPIAPFELPILNLDEDPLKCRKPLEAAAIDIRNAGTRSSGVSASEYVKTLTPANGPTKCERSLVMGWGRTLNGSDVNGTVRASLLICRPIFETAMFNVTIDSDGHVLSYNRTSKLERTLDYPDSEIHTQDLITQANYQWDQVFASWHNDTLSRGWMNYFLMLKTGSRSLLDPNTPVPDPNEMLPLVEDVYRRLYAILLSLNQQLFDHNEVGKPITVTRHTQEIRIFMEDASYIISLTILALNIVVALLFYARAVSFVLPQGLGLGLSVLGGTLGLTAKYIWVLRWILMWSVLTRHHFEMGVDFLAVCALDISLVRTSSSKVERGYEMFRKISP
ncbi:hypothetical protein AK830_g2552 [Neonectria ditissima]|uniref:Uncharacterized protein n=1 Tax=Neonectria ditissima TaxID=78410 RepID=A0A0P7BRY7_9HYPO|nr:hypothetical protein AK830_g2552 [Neonectria ditissima]